MSQFPMNGKVRAQTLMCIVQFQWWRYDQMVKLVLLVILIQNEIIEIAAVGKR